MNTSAQTGRVYGFTLKQHLRTKGYRMLTLIIAVFLILGIPLAMAMAANSSKTKENKPVISPVTTVAVADLTTSRRIDWSSLGGAGSTDYSHVEYIVAQTPEQAAQMCEEKKTSLIVVLSEKEGTLMADVLLPEGTQLERNDADSYSAFLTDNLPYVLMQKSGVNTQQLPELAVPILTQIQLDSAEHEPPEDQQELKDYDTKKVVSIVFTYVTIIMLYILIMAYGQATARSTIEEKSSKLMDTFLVSVRPRSMIMGKVLAMVTAGLLQFFIWAAGAVFGFWLGIVLAGRVNPDTPLGIVTLMQSFGALTGGMFSVAGIVIAILVVIAGFVMYCALAGFGGSMASKTEDLGSANTLFTLLLVASYMIIVFSGAMNMSKDMPTWLYYFPFSAVLATPGAVLVGGLSALNGLASLLIMVVFAYGIVVLAGKTYVMLTFYKGNPPNIGKIFKMLSRKDN